MIKEHKFDISEFQSQRAWGGVPTKPICHG